MDATIIPFMDLIHLRSRTRYPIPCTYSADARFNPHHHVAFNQSTRVWKMRRELTFVTSVSKHPSVALHPWRSPMFQV